MTRFHSYVVIWTTEPVRPGQTDLGEVLAFGPSIDAMETDLRPAPAWVTVAGFADDDLARTWFDTIADQVDGTALLFNEHAEPVWWPPEREAERPEWTRRLTPPEEKLGMFISIWLNVTDLEPFNDYIEHFRWTVEFHDGACLGSAPMPTVLKGGPGPMAAALMAWPTTEAAKGWYQSAEYRSYRDTRHAVSLATGCSVEGVRLVNERRNREQNESGAPVGSQARL